MAHRTETYRGHEIKVETHRERAYAWTWSYSVLSGNSVQIEKHANRGMQFLDRRTCISWDSKPASDRIFASSLKVEHFNVLSDSR